MQCVSASASRAVRQAAQFRVHFAAQKIQGRALTLLQARCTRRRAARESGVPTPRPSPLQGVKGATMRRAAPVHGVGVMPGVVATGATAQGRHPVNGVASTIQRAWRTEAKRRDASVKGAKPLPSPDLERGLSGVAEEEQPRRTSWFGMPSPRGYRKFE